MMMASRCRSTWKGALLQQPLGIHKGTEQVDIIDANRRFCFDGDTFSDVNLYIWVESRVLCDRFWCIDLWGRSEAKGVDAIGASYI
jgi:hypothetical protein